MLLMLPHNGQDGIRLLFIPKEGLLPSWPVAQTGSIEAQPAPLVLGAPSFLILGRLIPSDVRGSWVLVASRATGCDLIGQTFRENKWNGEAR